MKRLFFLLTPATALLLYAGAAFAAEQVTAQDAAQTQMQQQQKIYGSQLMTQQERMEFRAKMRDAKTAEQRQKIRAEHHATMQERAKQRGVSLPEEPPAQGMLRGSAMGRGAGTGMGMGQGRGAGK
ncbi:hypothetical protein [uncultured Desulfuromonas sp.]|uniref:hypothetical protein n=1 Tax=uncultured Desulfuromonas sp. TaxID=181013 RepID=UPI002AAA9850|nr:hypothetical protein [uncultured Desulfuromonas sp.]